MDYPDEWSKIDFSSLNSSVSEFFSPGEYDKMTDYEKKHLSNLRQNFEALKRAGLPVKPPEFMVRNKSEKEKKKLTARPLIDSSDDSDVEWTPAIERPRKVPGQSTKFIPPFMKKKPTEPSKPKKAKRRRKEEHADVTLGIQDEDVHLYPLRHKSARSFMSLRVPDDDDYLYCEECNHEFYGDCPQHGALRIVHDSEVTSMCKRGADDDYCRKTLPRGLAIRRSSIRGAGFGVFATQFFPARSRFGPYDGRKEKDDTIAHDSGYSWQVFSNGKPCHYVDASDPRESNWMRFVNCARSEDEQCVTAFQYQGEIYYRAHKDIHPGTEILVYYGDSYAKDLGIQVQKVGSLSQRVATSSHNKRQEDCVEEGPYKCLWCPFIYVQFNKREYHMKCSHKDEYTELIQESYQLWKSERNSDEDLHMMGHSLEILSTYFLGDNALSAAKIAWYRQKRKLLSCENNDKRIKKHTKTDLEGHNLESNTGKQADMRKLGNKELCLPNKLDTLHSMEESYKCKLANKEVSVKSTLARNQRAHSGEKPYICNLCNKGFSQNGDLIRHQRVHSGEKPYMCNLCNKGFSRNGDLIRHQRVHSGEKPYMCNLCNKGFSQNGDLIKHQRVHSGEKPYMCNLCNKGFSVNSSLIKHQRVHSGEKPYICNLCNKGFSVNSSLIKHQRVHSGEKPYICNLCNKGFSGNSDLIKHQRVHSGEKPYICNLCNKGFSVNCNLIKHQRVHSGEKPYICNLCNKGFSGNSDLIKHQRVHSGEEPS